MFEFLAKIDPMADWIEVFVIHQAMLAPFLLLLIEESGIPLPIPGDVYLAFIGYKVAEGKISYLVAFTLFLGAVLVGSSILYYVSSRWGHRIILKFGKYIHLSEEKLLTVEKGFKKYGVWVIIIGRHIPGFRVPITFFAGVSGVPYRTFIVSTFISVIFWIAFYLSLGRQVGKDVLKHVHASHWYLLLFAIPIVFFIGVTVYSRLAGEKK